MLNRNLLMEFSKIINEGKDKVKKEYNVYGTVSRVDGDTAYVKIDGSSIETPMSTSVSTLIGNRVSVRISDHSAIVTGNISDPSASKTTVDTIGSVATEAKTTAEDASDAAQAASDAAALADDKAVAAQRAAGNAQTAAGNAQTAAKNADDKAVAAQTAATAADERAQSAYSEADAAKKVATNYIIQNDNGITLGNASGGSMVGGQVNLNANGMSIINGQGNEVANYSNTTRIGFQSGHNVKIDNDSVDICSGEQVDATFGSTTRIGVSDGHNVKIDNDSIDICSGTQVDATFGSTTRIGVQNGHNVKIGNTSIDICRGEQADATFGSESIILRDKYGNEAVKLSVSGLVNELINQGRVINTTSSYYLPFPRTETISSSKNLTSGYYLVRNTHTNTLLHSVTNHSYIIELNTSYTSINTIKYYGPLVSKVEIYNSSTPSTVHTVGYFDVDENCDSVLDIKGLAKVSCEVLNPNTHGEISNGLVVGKDSSDQTVITPGWIFSRSKDGSSYKPNNLYINPSGGRVSFGGLSTYVDKDDNGSDYVQTDALCLGSVGKIDYTEASTGNNLNIGIDTAKMYLLDGNSSLVVGTNKSSMVIPTTVYISNPKVGDETSSTKLYYTKNDTIDLAGLRTAGVLTRTSNKAYNIRFTIFLSKPYYNTTNVSITNGGYKMRAVSTSLTSTSQVSGQYLFGGNASTNITASSTTCTLNRYGIGVTLAFTFTDARNEIYNAPVAIEIGAGILTFS